MPDAPKRRGRPPLTPEQRAERSRLKEQVAASARPAEEPEVLEPVLTATPAPILEAPEELARLGEPSDRPESPVRESLPPLALQKLKVHIHPKFGKEDKGDGGIRRVVEAQYKHLPKFGIELVDTAEEADVIAYHATVPSTYVKLYPHKAFVSMVHGLYWSEYKWDQWALKANEDVIEGIRVADVVVSCSEWVANAVRRHTSRPSEVIYHGVDLEDWNPHVKKDDFVLWNKTRPDPVCDPEPFNELAKLMPETAFISTFGAEGPNIAITGKLPFEDAKRFIERAGAYLCTTRETFGIGTLEAMACGVPVVGFDWGGQKEFIDHAIDGWLAAPGDFHGLAEGIRWAFANRDEIGLAAIRKSGSFTWERACERYAQIFMDAAAAKQQSSAPRTSIIITNYDLEKYLSPCVESVVSQTDQDWECIIVDDASPNPLGRQWAQQLAEHDSRFRLVANEKNLYLAEARNVGIRLAHGRYILPLDADDMLAPDAVALLADALDADRSIHVAYGNVLFVDEDGRTLTNYGPQFKPGHSSWPYPFSYEQEAMQRNLLPYCSMYRKEAWQWTGGYRRRCRTAEDADMWLRFSSYGFRPKMVTDADTLIYRNRNGSMSRTQGEVDWAKWFPWTKVNDLAPAGAVTKTQLPVSSLDPILISVVIPVGPGHEKMVTDAIDSVDAQSFRNWECVVVNDTGVPLVTELPSWVRVLETAGRVGTAAARNQGIAASRGKWFLPLDADDYLEPDALQFMWQAAKGTEEVIYSDFWQSDMTGTKVSLHKTDDYDPELITGKKRDAHGVTIEGMIHSVTALTLKSLWKKVGGYDESLPAWEDWDFQLSLANIGVCERRIAMPLFFYRKHTGFRREENYNAIEDSKAAIKRKWGFLWEGGKKLMSCGSCSRNKSIAPQGSRFGGAMTMQIKSQNDEAVLIRYIGEKQGGTPFRGAQSRTTYWFAAGEEKYVHQLDLDMFLARGDFVRVEIKHEDISIGEAPILTATGQA